MVNRPPNLSTTPQTMQSSSISGMTIPESMESWQDWASVSVMETGLEHDDEVERLYSEV